MATSRGVRHARELLAVLIVAVGGTLWLVVPDRKGGSLRDRSVIARWDVDPGYVLAAWVVVENAGPRTITLTEANLGSDLPDGIELLGGRARIGGAPTVSQGAAAPFLRLAGFEIPPGRFATVGFALRIGGAVGLVALEDVTVHYLENGDANTLRARRTARLCVRSPGGTESSPGEAGATLSPGDC